MRQRTGTLEFEPSPGGARAVFRSAPSTTDPRRLGTHLALAGMALLSMLALALPRQTTLRCDRAADRCTVERGLLGTPHVVTASEVRWAGEALEPECLRTAEDSVRVLTLYGRTVTYLWCLEPTSGGGDDGLDDARTIDAFLDGRTASVALVHWDLPARVLAGLGVLAALALVVSAFAVGRRPDPRRTVACTLDWGRAIAVDDPRRGARSWPWASLRGVDLDGERGGHAAIVRLDLDGEKVAVTVPLRRATAGWLARRIAVEIGAPAEGPFR